MDNSELLINKDASLIEALEKLNLVKNYINLTLFVQDQRKNYWNTD